MIDTMLIEVRELWDRLRWGLADLPQSENERGQIALVGLSGAGKKALFNALWGWQAVPPARADGEFAEMYRDYGLFRLIDLPTDALAMESAVYALDGAALIVYVLDGSFGLRAEDFQWIAKLRTSRAALLVVLNKADLLTDLTETRTDIQRRLALPVLPVSACDAQHIRGTLVEAMLSACPTIAIPLAAQIQELRGSAAQRLIRQAAVFSLMAGIEPLPVLDIALLVGVQVYLVMRISTLYGRRLTGQANWEVLITVAFGMGLRYLIETLAKFLPAWGWIAAGIVAISGTWAVGQAALAYYTTDLQTRGTETARAIPRQVSDAAARRLRR